jgi:hypothetical protein
MTPEDSNTANQPQARRTVRLPAPAEPAAPAIPLARRVPSPARRPIRDRLLSVAELVVGDWAPTLHDAALRVALFTLVLIVVGVAFGVEFAVLGLVFGVLVFVFGRRRAGPAR